MDFDLNITTLNGTQTAIYSTESQQAGRPAAAAPPFPSGLTVPSIPYNRLPAENVPMIAESLTLEDFDNFREANQENPRADLLLREKQLKKLDKIFPLLERVFQVERSGIEERVQEGTGLTVILRQKLEEFQEEELVEKIKELFKEAKNNTAYGAQVQEFLVNNFDHFELESEERADLFNFFFDESYNHIGDTYDAGKLWTALAAKLPQLNQDEQECIRGHKILLGKLHLPMAIPQKKEFIHRLITAVDKYNFSSSQQEKFVRFKTLFQAAERIQGGIDLQREIVEKLEVLTGKLRYQLFHFIYEKVQDQHPQNSDEENFLFEIGKQLALSTNDRYVDEYSDFVKYKLPLLNPAQRAELIPLLLDNVNQSDSVFSEYAYENHSTINVEEFTEIAKKLYEITKDLPPPYQGKPIGKLAEIVSNINSEDKVPFYQDVRKLAASLPDDQLCIALPGLVEGLMALPIDEHRRTDEFKWLNGPLARVGPEHRAQAALNLLRNVYMVRKNTFLFEWMWQSAVNLLHGTGENKLFDVLSELRKVETLFLLDDKQWQIAEGGIRDFMDRHQFSSQARAQIDNNIPWLRQKPNLL
ncbi:hypothetical protein IHE33_15655 (plasmid) [Mycetohabitans endofungorum]|uniref:hypothetical protein n=1 Tax=Mycetohabitans endofungorum TaxID=417203 RepID=UPI0030D3F36F